jgi:serine/threonine protein kinase
MTATRTVSTNRSGDEKLVGVAELPRGTAIGRYVILERIGMGGMGIVYSAYDYGLDRRVALKFLRPSTDAGAREREARMIDEAKAMARLSHPNVMVVHDVGRFDEHVFIAMELVDGTTLAEWLRLRQRRLDEIVRVLLQAGEGLAAAHAAGLVHGDFKPDNVLVGTDGRVRVTDFGLAHSDPLDCGGGTPGYMAPELEVGAADSRSDQFSFCVTVDEALEGLRVPAHVERAIARGRTADPDARHPSMRALLSALAARPLRWRAPAAIAAVALAGLVALVGIGRRPVVHWVDHYLPWMMPAIAAQAAPTKNAGRTVEPAATDSTSFAASSSTTEASTGPSTAGSATSPSANSASEAARSIDRASPTREGERAASPTGDSVASARHDEARSLLALAGGGASSVMRSGPSTDPYAGFPRAGAVASNPSSPTTPGTSPAPPSASSPPPATATLPAPSQLASSPAYALLGITSDGHVLAVDSSLESVRVLSVATPGEELLPAGRLLSAQTTFMTNGDTALLWHDADPQGSAAASARSQLSAWSPSTGLVALERDALPSLAAISPDGDSVAYFAHATPDGRNADFILESLATHVPLVLAQQVLVKGYLDSCVPQLAYSSKRLIGAYCTDAQYSSGVVRSYDPSTGKAIDLANPALPSFTLDPSGQNVLTYGIDSSATLVAVKTGARLWSAPWVAQGLFVAGGSQLVYTSTSQQAMRTSFSHSILLQPTGVSFFYTASPDGRYAMASSSTYNKAGQYNILLLDILQPQPGLELSSGSNQALGFTDDSSHALYLSGVDSYLGDFVAQPVAGGDARVLGRGAYWAQSAGGARVVFIDHVDASWLGDLELVDLSGDAGPTTLASSVSSFLIAADRGSVVYAAAGAQGGVFLQPLAVGK